MNKIDITPKTFSAIKEQMVKDKDLTIGLYAVVQHDKNSSFEFRTIDVNRDEGSANFDLNVLENALSEYSNEDNLFTTFTNALDLSSAIALIDIDELTSELKEPEGDEESNRGFILKEFLDELPGLSSKYMNGELDDLDPSEFSEIRGLLFAYEFNNSYLFGYQKWFPHLF